MRGEWVIPRPENELGPLGPPNPKPKPSPDPSSPIPIPVPVPLGDIVCRGDHAPPPVARGETGWVRLPLLVPPVVLGTTPFMLGPAAPLATEVVSPIPVV